MDRIAQATGARPRPCCDHVQSGHVTAMGVSPKIRAGSRADIGRRRDVAAIHSETEIEPAIAGFTRQSNGGLVIAGDSFLARNAKIVVEAAAKYRLPAVYANPEFMYAGGAYELHLRFCRPISRCSLLRRSHSQGSKTRRSAGPVSD